jgi:hypothetical protein
MSLLVDAVMNLRELENMANSGGPIELQLQLSVKDSYAMHGLERAIKLDMPFEAYKASGLMDNPWRIENGFTVCALPVRVVHRRYR